MAYNNEYPYTDPNRYNDDWLLNRIKEYDETIRNFIAANEIRYHDPIAWDKGTRYEKSTVVYAPNGDTLLSKKTVPAGIEYTNSEYWFILANYNAQFEELRLLIQSLFITPQQYGAKADGVTDDTEAIQTAINSGHYILFPSGTYLITSSIRLRSGITMLGINASIKRDLTGGEMYAFLGDYLEDVNISGIKFTSDKQDNDMNFLVYIYLQYGKNINISDCEFERGSAAIGLYDFNGAFIHDNVITNMFQFPASAERYAGVYGYGVSIDACYNVNVYANTLGKKGACIDRHSIYVSKSLKPDSSNINSNSNINIYGNTIVQLNYDEISPQTLAEYCIKVISGNQVNIYGNNIIGGYGAILLTAEDSGCGIVNISDNVYTGRYYFIRAVLVSTGEYKEVNLNNNTARLSAPYSIAVNFENVKKFMSRNNKYTSTASDKHYCFLQGEHSEVSGYIPTQFFYSENDIIDDYKAILRCNRIETIVYDSYSRISTSVGYIPFDIASSDLNDIVYNNNTYYNFIDNLNAVPDGMEFYASSPFGSRVKKQDGQLFGSNGLIVGSTQRPSNYPVGTPFYDMQNHITIFMSVYGWTESRVPFVSSMTAEELRAFNPSTQYGGSYSCTPVYNRDDHLPYWWDAYYNVWKDAAGNELQ